VTGAAPTSRRRFAQRVPSWLAPRESTDKTLRRGPLWMYETFVLIVVGIVLSVAVIYDLSYDVGNDHRMAADVATWRLFVGQKPTTIWAHPVQLGHTTDVSCGTVALGPAVNETQVCLLLVGPVRNGLRRIYGGWQLAWGLSDHTGYRFACFGSVVNTHWCPRPRRPRSSA
jgi:hypothetical protein